ncbi:hypothetical protein BN946_scf184317.g1, partial [Trametes cinnabarina]
MQPPVAQYPWPVHDPDIVAWVDNFPLRESTCCTIMLAGATFTEAVIVDYKGKNSAVFVFS